MAKGEAAFERGEQESEEERDEHDAVEQTPAVPKDADGVSQGCDDKNREGSEMAADDAIVVLYGEEKDERGGKEDDKSKGNNKAAGKPKPGSCGGDEGVEEWNAEETKVWGPRENEGDATGADIGAARPQTGKAEMLVKNEGNAGGVHGLEAGVGELPYGPEEINSERGEHGDENEKGGDAGAPQGCPEGRLSHQEERDDARPRHSQDAGAAEDGNAGAEKPPPGGGERIGRVGGLPGLVESPEKSADDGDGAGELHNVRAGLVEVIPDKGMNAENEKGGVAKTGMAAKEVEDGKEAGEEPWNVGSAEGNLREAKKPCPSPDVEHVKGHLHVLVVLAVEGIPPAMQGSRDGLHRGLGFIDPKALGADSDGCDRGSEKKENQGREGCFFCGGHRGGGR